LWKSNNRDEPSGRVPEQLVPLGELVSTHGLDGWLKLNPYNPQSTLLYSTKEVLLEKDGIRSLHYLKRSRVHQKNALVKLQGIDEINHAKKLIGSVLYVGETALQPLEPGEFYYYQVVGFNVLDTHGEWIGKITRIWFKQGGDLYVVAGISREHLIPAVQEVIEKIDIRARKMTINPPEGLLEV